MTEHPERAPNRDVSTGGGAPVVDGAGAGSAFEIPPRGPRDVLKAGSHAPSYVDSPAASEVGPRITAPTFLGSSTQRATTPPPEWGADHVLRSVIANATALGTPAADLTDAQRVAICMALGMDVEIRTEMDAGCYRLVFTTPPVAIVDRGDGGYIVATPAGVRLA